GRGLVAPASVRTAPRRRRGGAGGSPDGHVVRSVPARALPHEARGHEGRAPRALGAGLRPADDEGFAGLRVTPAQLRRLCLKLSGAEETFPFVPEASVFKVGGKMFAIAALKRQPLRVSVKCEPELGEQLRGTYDEIEPGYHLNKRHWVTVTCGGAATDELVRELVAGSYDLVA